jgi:DNA helicase-2/ATP-dependent DNA helicase PcrA
MAKKKQRLKQAESQVEAFLLGESTAEKSQADAAQEKAIHHKEGPILIVAGAGTGKTRVITERIAWLINSKLAKPDEILALTFSEKAAKEMERRVDSLVPYGMVDTHISTFHSFGHDIISDSFAELRIAPDWQILKKPDSIIFIVENIEKLGLDLYKPLNNPAQYVAELTDFISKLKDSLVTPGIYARYVEDLKAQGNNGKEEGFEEILAQHEELSRFYTSYEKLKLEKNYMDFGDLIMVPYNLLKEKKAVLAKYQARHKFILVDEFQDTNFAQFELIKLIAEKYRNMTVVGDDDQMIYRFRGAAISNIMGFKDCYPDAEVVVLKNNYRSVQPILDVAYKLIQNNTDRLETLLNIEKHLESKYKSGHSIEPVVIKYFQSYSEEADFIAGEIEKHVKSGRYMYRDFAILLRARNDARMFLKTLERRGIPYKFTGDEGLFNKKEVQFLINFCRMLATPYEFNPVFDVAISEFYGIDPYVMSKIGSRAKQYSITALDMMKRPEIYPELELDSAAQEKISRLIQDNEYYADLVKQGWNAGEILYDYIKNRRIFESLLKEKTIEADRKIANISRFFDVLKQFSISDDYDTVYNFISYIDLRQKSGDNPASDIFEDMDDDSVQAATIHKAKGLEYKVVFVPALIQDKFPVRFKGGFPFPLPEAIMKDMVAEKLYMQEEERRLFYVAITRAKECLVLTYSKQYEGAGNKKPSMFLLEVGFKEPESLVKAEKEDKLKYFEKIKVEVKETGPAGEKKVLKLSNYQIDDYLTCPYKYKLIHVLRVPIREEPNIIYGQAMHKVASEFFKARQENKTITIEEMKDIFRAIWKPVGFISAQHEQRRYEQGLHNIEEFYNNEMGNDIVPKYIEKDFEYKLGEDIIIRGRWDRIDEINGKWRIIDYKTSDVKDVEKAEEKLDSANISRQLKLYSISFEKVFGKPVDEVGVYFFESRITAVKKMRKDTLEKYEAQIHGTAASIREGDFTASPSAFVCKYCAFFNICPHSKADVLF